MCKPTHIAIDIPADAAPYVYVDPTPRRKGKQREGTASLRLSPGHDHGPIVYLNGVPYSILVALAEELAVVLADPRYAADRQRLAALQALADMRQPTT